MGRPSWAEAAAARQRMQEPPKLEEMTPAELQQRVKDCTHAVEVILGFARGAEVIEHQLPLDNQRLAILRLPRDFTNQDARRVFSFVMALAFKEPEPTQPPGDRTPAAHQEGPR